MQKLTAKEALEIYKLAWTGDMTNSEIAERYHVSKNVVSSIKHGFTWNSVTLYIRGKVPAIAQTPFKEKMKTIFKKPDTDLTIDNRYWDLWEQHGDEYGEDVAKQFRQSIHEKRGLLRRKLTINEVEDIYQKFKNGSS